MSITMDVSSISTSPSPPSSSSISARSSRRSVATAATCSPTLTNVATTTTLCADNFEQRIQDLTPTEQEAVRKFWRSVVMRNAPRVFGDENGRLPQMYAAAAAANVRSCNCCPYGYHIDLDFVRYCEALANAKPSEEELQRRSRRRSRKSMEFMLGLDGLFEQWDAAMRVQALPEAPHENDSPDSLRALPPPSALSTATATAIAFPTCQYQQPQQQHQQSPATAAAFTCSTPYEQRPRSSSVPRFTYGAVPRAESPFGTASSTCSSVRGAESDAPYSVLRQRYGVAESPGDTPETRAFLREALDEVCSDFERTLERTSVRRKKATSYNDGRQVGAGSVLGSGILNVPMSFNLTATPTPGSDRNNNQKPYAPLMRSKTSTTLLTNSSSSNTLLRNGYSWERNYDVLDSCVTGNKSPRSSRYHGKGVANSSTNTALPYQPKLSPAEQQYESYVQATVAANAKSPVELPAVASNITTITTTLTKVTTATSTPPPPPPRRHTLQSKLLSPPAANVTTTTKTTTTTDAATQSMPSEGVGDSGNAPHSHVNETSTATSDAQTLYNIRQQMALSLKRMRDLEEQVKSIPELQHELTQLRHDNQRLQQLLQSKESEVQRTREPVRLSNTPSPVASLKNVHNGPSPVSFTPQRISPVSLESLGARLRTNSNTSERQGRATLRRDVGTMCGLHATRDIGVGSPLALVRSVGTSPAQQLLSINELLYTQYELEQYTHEAVRTYEEQRNITRLQKLISVGTQMFAPRCASRDSAVQTAVAEVRRLSVGVLAKPTTCDNYVNCRQDVRTLGCSDDRITDVLCERCRVLKRSVGCSTEDAAFQQVKSVSLKLLDMPGRSNTFSLGEHERIGRIRKSTGTQYTPALVHHIGIQTAEKLVRAATVQCKPEQQHAEVQCAPASNTQQTDTRDLLRLCTTQTSTEEIKPAMPVIVVKPPAQTCHAACNTDAPARTVDAGMNTLAAAVNIRHSAANTEQVHKRDIGCGDIVKPHISIACADNYCDSCKDAIKHLAKDFSKVSTPPATPLAPMRSTSTDSRIPRPKHITSPSPVRRVFQRQNTYTITSPPTSSTAVEQQNSTSSLHEKPPSITSFHDATHVSETQSFITEPKSTEAMSTTAATQRATNASVKRAEELEAVFSAETAPTASGSNSASAQYEPLIVKEEKRVCISWSRDASPASTQRKGSVGSASPQHSLDTSYNEKLKQDETASTNSATTNSSSSATTVVEQPIVDVSKGARKKITTTNTSPTLKSSQSSKIKPLERDTQKLQVHEAQGKQPPAVPAKISITAQQEPSKALLQKLAMVEAEPRKKAKPPKEMLCALKIINESLLKKMGAKPFSSQSLKSAKLTIQQEWFRVSSTEDANPHEVEDYLDCFEELSVPLLEYCVNMVDANGNTAMHYAVSHGNFDVVSILLDSKVCNVNQMNNAGYTCVMLVSLAKLKNTAHRTVVQRLFQIADVNIRAKKHCQTALMLAVSHGNTEMVQLLLEAGADINIQDEDGSTALMCAAEHGRVDIVKQLLSQPDCDSLVTDADGATAFKIAWQAGHREIGLILYVHEQVLRSKLPNNGETTVMNTSYTVSKDTE